MWIRTVGPNYPQIRNCFSSKMESKMASKIYDVTRSKGDKHPASDESDQEAASDESELRRNRNTNGKVPSQQRRTRATEL